MPKQSKHDTKIKKKHLDPFASIENLLVSCRICLVKTKIMHDIFNFSSENTTNSKEKLICEKLMFCTGVKMDKKDGLPKKICYMCLSSIDAFYEFKALCIKSDEKLKEAIHKNTLDDIKTTFADIKIVKLENIVPKDEGFGTTSDIKEDYEGDDYHYNDGDTMPMDDAVTLSDDDDFAEIKNQFQNNILNKYKEITIKVNKPDKEKGLDDIKPSLRDKEEGLTKVEPSYLEIEGFTDFEPKHEPTTEENIKLKDGGKANQRQIINCEVCDRKYFTQKKFNEHLKNCDEFQHQSIKKPRFLRQTKTKLKAQDAEKPLFTKRKVKRKKIIETDAVRDEINNALICQTCDEKFTTKDELREHRKIHLEPNIICEFCGMVMRRCSYFSAHRRSHMVANIKCDKCNYATSSRPDMRKHMLFHAGVRNFRCEQCGKAYFTASNLNSHIRAQHLGERNYACEVCGKTFYCSTRRNRHQDTHNNIKRYPCEICGVAFSRRDYWRKHTMSVHHIDVPKAKGGKPKQLFRNNPYLPVRNRRTRDQIEADKKAHVEAKAKKRADRISQRNLGVKEKKNSKVLEENSSKVDAAECDENTAKDTQKTAKVEDNSATVEKNSSLDRQNSSVVEQNSAIDEQSSSVFERDSSVVDDANLVGNNSFAVESYSDIVERILDKSSLDENNSVLVENHRADLETL